MSNAFSLRCIYLSCKVLYFILSDDDIEIKSKIYSFNLRLVLKHILHSQDVFFRNLLFTLKCACFHAIIIVINIAYIAQLLPVNFTSYFSSKSLHSFY